MTAVSAALAAAVGRGVAGTVAVAAAVLAGQLSIGWMNDYLDRDRDVRVHRADKPVAAGTLAPATVRTATAVAAVAVVPLSLLSGWFAGSLHLIAVASAWSYNLWLKATVLSVLPYAVSFGLLPAFITAGLPGQPVYGWLVAAGALLGAGAHFANVLPDIDDDLRTGRTRAAAAARRRPARRVAAGTLLAAASLVLAVGPPGPPGAARGRRGRGRRRRGRRRRRCSGGGRAPGRRSSACWWSRRSTWRCWSPRVRGLR